MRVPSVTLTVMRREILLVTFILSAVGGSLFLLPTEAVGRERSAVDLAPAWSSAFEEARELLASGEVEKARESALAELSTTPYSVEGYQLLREIAAAEDDLAAELRWGKWLYWSYRAAGLKKETAALAEELTELHADWNLDGLLMDDWNKSTYAAVKTAKGKKHFRLAGHLLAKLMAMDPGSKKLSKDYDKLIDDAGNEVTGGAFVSSKVRSKSEKWIAKQNAKHEAWEDRWERKTKYYELETNMDYEFFETVSAAMDEMHLFYRDVLDYSKKAPRARVAIHRKRSDFDRFSQDLLGRAIGSESVGGYWAPQLKTVVTFDRSYGDPNKTRADLWNTLFHEASHQFTSLMMEKNERKGIYCPAWLNEGTASYFEGCRIKADGTIVKNDIAEGRLRSWWWLEGSKRKHSLEDLIAHIRNTGPDSTGLLSYEGDYYSYGWSLVYFLLNYEENDRRVYAPPITPGQGIPEEYKAVRKAGKLVYRQPYLDYLEHFAKVGNKDNDQHYPFEIAKQFFVDEVGDPDVPNWEAFENRWRKFTTSLYRELESGWEFADVLQARCRGYILAEDFERARITAEQADDKRPNDPETYRLLAESNLGAEREGDAVYWMFRHWEMMWPSDNEEATLAAEEWLIENGGKELVKKYCEPSKVTLASMETAMEEALAGGQPVLATMFATHAMTAFNEEFPQLLEVAQEMTEISGQDMRMWQPAFNKGPDGNRKVRMNDGSLIDGVVYQPDGMLMFDPEGWERPGYERCDVGTLNQLAPPFAVRGTVQVDGNAGRILLGMDRAGRPKSEIAFYLDDKDNASVAISLISVNVDTESGTALSLPRRIGDVFIGDVNEMRGSTGGVQYDFVIEFLGDDKGRMTVGDNTFDLPDKLTDRVLEGGIGLAVTEDTAVLFQNIEVRPNKAFWPVAPQGDDEE